MYITFFAANLQHHKKIACIPAVIIIHINVIIIH